MCGGGIFVCPIAAGIAVRAYAWWKKKKEDHSATRCGADGDGGDASAEEATAEGHGSVRSPLLGGAKEGGGFRYDPAIAVVPDDRRHPDAVAVAEDYDDSVRGGVRGVLVAASPPTAEASVAG